MYEWQVFSTLSSSAHFSKWDRGFDVVIIDEAAQAVSSYNPFYLFQHFLNSPPFPWSLSHFDILKYNTYIKLIISLSVIISNL